MKSQLCALALTVLISSCGAAAQQHETLNWITRVADPTYGMVVDACDDLRDHIIDRPGSTRERDRADMGRINDVCDRAVASFELLRQTQLSARAAIDAGVPGATASTIGRALEIWRELQALSDGILNQSGGGS